ncbi:MAG: hypothetical protein WDZ37_05215 [Solirubrobacterales bacterium]
MAVALIALLVSLSGTGYAVSKLPRNSVGTKQLKRGAVTATKIRNGAITAAKIRKGAISGDKVSSTTLAKVPDADRLDGRDSSDFVSASVLRTFNVPMNRGDPTKAVASLGSFNLQGRCVSDPTAPGKILAALEATTSAANSYFWSDVEWDQSWNPGETRTVQLVSASPGSSSEDSSSLKMFTALGPYLYEGDGEPVGVLVGFTGAECRFIGHVVLYS